MAHVVRLGKALAFAASLALFAFAVWYAWAAFMVPLELEIREGTNWLLVLAKRAGVDIYDSRRVAFLNMNHGPMDLVFKTWISSLFPRLAGHAVVRIFVLAAPFVMLLTARRARGNWTEALLAAGALSLMLANVAIMMIVGRSDATLLCETILACGLTHELLVTRHRLWTNGRAIVLQLLLGACSATMFLTTWRVIPTIGILLLLTLARQVSETNYRFWRTVFGSLGLFALGFALVWGATFLLEVHGDFDLYFKHFFGYFMAGNGWGTFSGPRFTLWPPELVDAHARLLALTAGLALFALYRIRRERAQVIVWLLVLPVAWVTNAYGYWKNQGGGGLHYFTAFFVTVWFLIVHGLRGRVLEVASRPWWRPVMQLAFAGAFFFAYDWRPLIKRGQHLQELRVQSLQFLKNVAARVGQEPVPGEDSHLYKRKYMGEVVDSGDVADYFAATKYFGESFTRVYEAYLANLEAHPPKYLMAAGFDRGRMADTTSRRFNQLLHQRYRLAIEGPWTMITNGGGATFLYERKD
ncbi:MAG TPA: hypothetical protein VHK47_13575 [Polyangia bacterium]|nr:hypothetical protein [Polyangia bacterium]